MEYLSYKIMITLPLRSYFSINITNSYIIINNMMKYYDFIYFILVSKSEIGIFNFL